jgi:hypothetical protein
MNPDTTPTPEGWHEFWPCFIRKHGDKTAVLDHSSVSGWWCRIHRHENLEEENGFLPLAGAVAWANEQLGVPKPVVVHERGFDDGSVLVWREDGKASARVSHDQGSLLWYIDGLDEDRGARESALTAAHDYVRGGQ